MWGAIGGAVTGDMNSPQCFVAGTLVCTIDGEVPIEDIQVGELRYSDTLMDSNGGKLHLDSKSKEHLENPVTVYNFAVDDYQDFLWATQGKGPQEPGFARQHFLTENIGQCPVFVFLMKNKKPILTLLVRMMCLCIICAQ